MKLIKSSILIGIAIITTGCAQSLWVKPNAGQGEFERDRYSCLQQSQQRVGAAQVNAYGGSSINTVETNGVLFSTCMGSKGWSLQSKEAIQSRVAQDQAKNDELKAKNDQVRANAVAMCNNEELKEYYKKTSCNSLDVSFQHIADTSKITQDQKIALIKQRDAVALIEKQLDEITRQLGEMGAKRISIALNFTRPENEKNNLDLYNEKITWGEYNKRRKEIALETQNRFGR